MTRLRDSLPRLAGFLRRDRWERELDEELREQGVIDRRYPRPDVRPEAATHRLLRDTGDANLPVAG
jgi:hypothetical protein